jgi:hypothetical protein
VPAMDPGIAPTASPSHANALPKAAVAAAAAAAAAAASGALSLPIAVAEIVGVGVRAQGRLTLAAHEFDVDEAAVAPPSLRSAGEAP